MSIWRLIVKEIVHRRLNFVLATLGVVVAAGAVVGVLTLLRGHRIRVERIAEAQAKKAGQIGFGLKDDARRITLNLGYNVLILHKDQDLGEFYTRGLVSRTFPESYADRLAQSDVVVVQHVLPSLHRRLEWPEKKKQIILIGVRGEIQRAHMDPKKPLIQPVPRGEMVVGRVLAEEAGLKVGQEVTLLGRRFKVRKIHQRRGDEDDYTAWINLHDAQELFDQPGRIDTILALSCFCANASLGSIQEQIGRVLPETRAIVLEHEAMIRQATRSAAGRRAEEFLALEKTARQTQRAEREALAAWVIPLVVVGGIVWVGLLALGNVRARRTEIGILRAMGVRSGQVFRLFLGRAVLVGAVGAVVGYLVGFGLAVAWDARETTEGALASGPVGPAGLFGPWLLVGVLLAAPLLSAAASLAPALLAAQEDPADILREE